jgi:very-short-patch-repair endonuclease
MIAELAARQHGVVSLCQLLALGLTHQAVSKRCATGRLHRIHRGVYAVGHSLLTPDGHRMAAVLACGDGAVLGHHAAGRAWGLLGGGPAVIDVIRQGRGSRSLPGINAHSARTLDARDVTRLRGIPITTIARTLLDLATDLDDHRLERACHEAEVLRLFDLHAIRDTLERNNAHRGVGRLRCALRGAWVGHTRSQLEHLFAALVREGEMRLPELNVRVRASNVTYEVDALWRPEKVVVELDGAAVHQTRHAFEADRCRDAALVAAGYVVVRLTWRRITLDPGGVLRELHEILRSRAGLATTAR